jgi:hypothetical protein
MRNKWLGWVGSFFREGVMRTLRFTSVLAATLCLTALSSARAQSTVTTITGKVHDKAGQPIPSAEVTIFATKLKVLTTDSGTYRITDVPPGKYWIGVRRLGYEPVAFTATIKANTSRDFEVELEALPQRLSEQKIIARSKFGHRYDDFDRRRRSAWGYFFTRDDIEKRHPYSLASVVGFYFPHVTQTELEWPSPFPVGSGQFASLSRTRRCVPAVSVNGGIPMAGWGLGGFAPNDVEAMEIYRAGAMHIPMEFQNYDTACGLVVLWLK